MCGSEEGKTGGREGRREGGKGAEKRPLTGPRRRPWCSFHAPRPVRLLVRCLLLSLLVVVVEEEGGAAGWRQGGRRD